ncbi:MAG: alginate lyase family protein [Woeseia sp.]|nr:heparinase II/III family protein [Woeseia sp.]MBT8095883.1 heparinase II/III family protein [Woeseia sp.]NNE61968.1 alginate lyase family protein [Woeseia sp.]
MNLFRLFRTVRYLRLRQITARVQLRFAKVDVGEADQTTLTNTQGDWVRPTWRRAEVTDALGFKLLNQEIDVRDNNWNPAGRDKLLLYHLHYLDALNTEALADNPDHGLSLITRWIDNNPPCEGNGWEPYPLSLRIVNWIKWHLSGNALPENALASLFLQLRALDQQIEYHLLANHLFENGKALYFGGLFFDGPEAASWRQQGAKILRDEVSEQVLADGGHFELSPMYHAIIAEDLLDILNIARAYNDTSLGNLEPKIGGMLEWLDHMTHPDGQLANFNDATQGIAATPAEIRAYAERLGINASPSPEPGISYLKDSGYVRFRGKGVDIAIDIGEAGVDYQPGHSHCDLLSFEASVGQQRLVVNTGISTYNNNQRRLYERSTAAHNTVSLDGQEQSEIWSAFRLGRRARPIDIDVGKTHVQAAHDGFRSRDVVHRRRFDFLDGQIKIEDWLESSNAVSGNAHFHFHPSVTPCVSGQCLAAGGVIMTFENATRIDMLDYDFCEGFNKTSSGKKAIVSFEGYLSCLISYENTLPVR